MCVERSSQGTSSLQISTNINRETAEWICRLGWTAPFRTNDNNSMFIFYHYLFHLITIPLPALLAYNKYQIRSNFLDSNIPMPENIFTMSYWNFDCSIAIFLKCIHISTFSMQCKWKALQKPCKSCVEFLRVGWICDALRIPIAIHLEWWIYLSTALHFF